jgi:hypothetical protein
MLLCRMDSLLSGGITSIPASVASPRVLWPAGSRPLLPRSPRVYLRVLTWFWLSAVVCTHMCWPMKGWTRVWFAYASSGPRGVEKKRRGFTMPPLLTPSGSPASPPVPPWPNLATNRLRQCRDKWAPNLAKANGLRIWRHERLCWEIVPSEVSSLLEIAIVLNMKDCAFCERLCWKIAIVLNMKDCGLLWNWLCLLDMKDSPEQERLCLLWNWT